MSHFSESGSEHDTILCIVEESAGFSLSGRREDILHDVAGGVNGTILESVVGRRLGGVW